MASLCSQNSNMPTSYILQCRCSSTSRMLKHGRMVFIADRLQCGKPFPSVSRALTLCIAPGRPISYFISSSSSDGESAEGGMGNRWQSNASSLRSGPPFHPSAQKAIANELSMREGKGRKVGAPLFPSPFFPWGLSWDSDARAHMRGKRRGALTTINLLPNPRLFCLPHLPFPSPL